MGWDKEMMVNVLRGLWSVCDGRLQWMGLVEAAYTSEVV
jgi:hypothetical protein